MADARRPSANRPKRCTGICLVSCDQSKPALLSWLGAHVPLQVNKHTIQSLREDYEAAISWMADRGCPVARGRLAQYGATIADLASSFEASGWGDLADDQRRRQVCTTLLEIREVISIHRGLTAIPDPQATRALQRFLKGPFAAKDEVFHNSSNQARNIGFELYLNALFSFAGFEPKFDSAADLSFAHRGEVFFVEAKRPANVATAKRLTRDANRQLSNRLSGFAAQATKGLIALDLTKIINPDGEVMRVLSDDHLQDLMHNEADLQIGALRSTWHRHRHPRTVGALLHYRLMTNFVDTGALNTLRWVGVVKFVADEPALDDIDRLVGEAIKLLC